MQREGSTVFNQFGNRPSGKPVDSEFISNGSRLESMAVFDPSCPLRTQRHHAIQGTGALSITTEIQIAQYSSDMSAHIVVSVIVNASSSNEQRGNIFTIKYLQHSHFRLP